MNLMYLFIFLIFYYPLYIYYYYYISIIFIKSPFSFCFNETGHKHHLHCLGTGNLISMCIKHKTEAQSTNGIQSLQPSWCYVHIFCSFTTSLHSIYIVETLLFITYIPLRELPIYMWLECVFYRWCIQAACWWWVMCRDGITVDFIRFSAFSLHNEMKCLVSEMFQLTVIAFENITCFKIPGLCNAIVLHEPLNCIENETKYSTWVRSIGLCFVVCSLS